MADIVIFDEGAIPEAVLAYRKSAHTANFLGRTDVLINPDVSAVLAVPRKYWKHQLGTVAEMTIAEKLIIDTLEATNIINANRSGPVNEVDEVSPVGVKDRAMIELHNKRANYIINRLIELQNRVQAMLDSTGGVANMRVDGLAVPISATSTRTKPDAVQDYKDDINAGNQDT